MFNGYFYSSGSGGYKVFPPPVGVLVPYLSHCLLKL
uniref:Uncharacterized protein n=1 Tax=Cyanothece sp. (strain PCC 7425 / ATCC 29141) TaxID=395961 RepID=B8HK79_CYAP4